MSITYVDTDLLEQVRDRMVSVLSKVEESAGTLRQMHSQMMAEDANLSAYVQWSQAVDGCDGAMRKTELLNERAERLLNILDGVSESYKQMENQHVQAVERLTVRMSTLGAGMAGVMATDYPMGLEEGETNSSALELERQTSVGVQSLEIANLMAVTQVLKEEFSYDQVMPGMPTDELQEQDKKKKSSKTTEAKSSEETEEEKEDGQQA